MPWTTKQKLKLSINDKLIDKEPPEHKRDLAQNFDEYDLTLDELAHSIGMGLAFSYRFSKGHRKSSNFICADFLCVDMDGARTLEDTLSDPIVTKYCSLYYTTPSHSRDHHRFRLVFVTPRTLLKVEDAVYACRALSRRLDGDMSATDGARMFYGSSKSEPVTLGNRLSDAFLEELIVDGSTFAQPYNHTPLGKHTSSRSRQTLDIESFVTTVEGAITRLGDIKDKTTIHCPFHHDTTASSFASRNKDGNLYHYCSVCQITRWEPNDDSLYNFNDFEDAVVSIGNRSERFGPDSDGMTELEKMIDEDDDYFDTVQQISITNDRYLKPIDIHDGITFIKSPKGTGKTEFLKHNVRSFYMRYPTFEEYEIAAQDDDPKIYNPNSRVLLIGHRQALIGELCQRIGLNCYLDDSKFREHENVRRHDRYGICLDSLWKIKDEAYDLIVIDEVEQVLSHFLSDTIGKNRLRIFEIFTRLIRNARKVIALDADLGWVTFHTLTDIARLREEPTKIAIHLNRHFVSDRKVDLYPTVGHFSERLKAAIAAGERLFISSNSKKMVKKFDKIIGKLERDLGIHVPRIVITSENSKSPSVQQFIKDVKNQARKYKAILSSPSLGTGIDISFEDDEQIIDSVFGFYHTQINNHFDIDQQLSRVRNPKNVSVFISPQKFRFETEFDVVRQDIINELLPSLAGNNFTLAPDDQTDIQYMFLHMCARIVSTTRYSMNRLRRNFIAHKESQGFLFNWIESNENQRLDGNQSIRLAGEELRDENIEQLLGAEPLNLYDYTRVSDRFDRLQLPITDVLLLRYRRTSLEKFYQEPVTKELIAEDNGSALRGQISLYRKLIDKLNRIRKSSIKEANQKRLRLQLETVKDNDIRPLILSELLRSALLFDGYRFNPSCDLCTDDLNQFIEKSKKLRKVMQTQFNIETQKDIDQKPTQHLSKLLRLIGLRLFKSGSRKFGQRKVNFYRLDPDCLARLMDLAKRQEPHDVGEDELKDIGYRYGPGWVYINDKYEFDYSNEELDWLLPVGWDGGPGYRQVKEGHEKWSEHIGLNEELAEIQRSGDNDDLFYNT